MADGSSLQRKASPSATPAGVGAFQNPQIFIKTGDVVEIEADGIGILITPIVAG